jgi:hypothetical protein
MAKVPPEQMVPAWIQGAREFRADVDEIAKLCADLATAGFGDVVRTPFPSR